MKRIAEMTFVLISIVLISVCLASCQSAEQTSTEANASTLESKELSKAINPINVKIETVSLGRLTEYITVTGETIADKDVTYSAEVAGRIEVLSVDLGDSVKKGHSLARIDYEMLKAQFEQAQANYNLTEKTIMRLSALLKDELISDQEIDEARSVLIQAKAQLTIANANLRKSKIVSGIDGIVARKFVEEGEFVGPGSPIVQVVDLGKIVVKAQLPETLAPRVRRESPAKVGIDALGREFDGKVHVVVPASDPMSKTFQLRVKVDNPDFSILIGMAANLRIKSETFEDVIVVQQDAVIEEGYSRSVYVEENGIARKRAVKLGPIEGHRVILLEGVKPGDRLIVVGQRGMVDSQPVRIIQ